MRLEFQQAFLLEYRGSEQIQFFKCKKPSEKSIFLREVVKENVILFKIKTTVSNTKNKRGDESTICNSSVA